MTLSLDANNRYGYMMSKVLPTSELNLINLEKFDLNRYNNNSSKNCVLEVYLGNSEELPELHNHCLLLQVK